MDPEKTAKLQLTKEKLWLELKTLRAEKGTLISNTALRRKNWGPESLSDLTRPKSELAEEFKL